MKKSKLTRKLVLSCATLGVAAASVVSTTYAWFTMGNSAKINEVQNSAESAGAGLLLSQTGEASSWTDDLTLASATGKTLKPAAAPTIGSNGNITYKKFDGASAYTDVSAGTISTATDVLAFDLYMQASSGDSTIGVDMTATFSNKTESKQAWKLTKSAGTMSSGYTSARATAEGVSQNIAASSGLTAANDTVYINILDALYMTVYKVEGTTYTATETYPVSKLSSGLSQKTYFKNQKEDNHYPTSDVPTLPGTTKGELMADDLSKANTIENAFEAAATEAGSHYVVVIWLNGEDDECFDPVSAQNWAVNFKFEVHNTAE